MFILMTVALLFATTVALVVLSLARPQFRFSWLIAVGAAFLAWMLVIFWRGLLPFSISFAPWGLEGLIPSAPTLLADQYSWIYALSLVSVALATLLTATVREGFPDATTLAGAVGVCGLGVLAVTAGNPLTLALIWAGLDLAELAAWLRTTAGQAASQRLVTTFAVHAGAIVLLMLAQVISSSPTQSADFASITPQAGLLLLAAAGLRLGVLPLHVPYVLGSSFRRGIGTSIRLTSAAASLILLSRVPAASLSSLPALIILILSAGGSLYAAWMWLRAPDELAGRPFWIIGLAGLAMFSALRGNPAGSVAWGTALVLTGAALFLSSAQQVWLNRLLFVGAWEVSALPFSITAAGWSGRGGILDLGLPVFIVVQAFLVAGFVRHTLRPAARTSLQTQPAWARSVYPAGIGLLLVMSLLLGLWGWDGALQVGTLASSIAATVLTVGLVWAVPRLPVLNPVPAHWLKPTSPSRLEAIFKGLLGIYSGLGRASQTITDVLEGEAGLLWTLLFLVLFIVLIVQRSP
ncbi:MAG TPA: hypothetical protein VF784_13170 [Anaerolineales bacterium]